MARKRRTPEHRWSADILYPGLHRYQGGGAIGGAAFSAHQFRDAWASSIGVVLCGWQRSLKLLSMHRSPGIRFIALCIPCTRSQIESQGLAYERN